MSVKHYIIFGRIDHEPDETLERACNPEARPESGDSAVLLSVPDTWSYQLVRILAAGIFADWDWCPDTFREEAKILPIDLSETFVARWVMRYDIVVDGTVTVTQNTN